MQAVSGRYIDFGGKPLLNQILNGCEINEGEATSRVIIDKQVEIAFVGLPRLARSNQTSKEKSRRAPELRQRNPSAGRLPRCAS